MSRLSGVLTCVSRMTRITPMFRFFSMILSSISFKMFNFEPFNSNELHCNYIEFNAKINEYIVITIGVLLFRLCFNNN